ncbi:MAG: ABC transporter substrate-binding protein [Acidimicrobiales bacterium]
MALGLVVGSCGGEDDSNQPVASGCDAVDVPERESTSLVIEGDAWAGYAPFRSEDLLDGTGYTALYVEQSCEEQRAADLSSGDADIAVTTLDQYVLHQPAATVVGVVGQSQGSDALVLDTLRYRYLDGIDDLRQLVEERGDERPVLAYVADSPSEMMLDHLASTNQQLRLSDFELAEVDRSVTAYQMLQSGEAQLAMLGEPDTSTARDAGFTVAVTSEDVPNLLVDVILASNRLIERDPGAVGAVLDAFYTAMDGYLADRDALVQLIAEDAELSEFQAMAVVDGLKLYGTNDASTFMNERVFPLDRPQVAQSIEAIGAVLAVENPDLQLGPGSVDGSFVAELAEARYGSGVGTDTSTEEQPAEEQA